MQRNILFKAKRKDNSEWVEGYYSETPYKELPEYAQFLKGKNITIENRSKYELRHYITTLCNSTIQIIPETVCQYIGRLDKNKKRIFEKSKCKHYINKDFVVYLEGIVEYLEDRYILRYSDKSYTDFMFIKSDDIEVIGNVFDEGEENERNK